MEAAFRRVPREQIYEVTGLQFLPFNTAYQLLALRRAGSPLLEAAETLLMMPDLFAWLLTGRRVGERTDASTTQLLDPRSGTWSDALCRGLDLPRQVLPELIEPGTEIGPMLRSVADEVGIAAGLTVLAPGTHDTASAVAAVPAVGPASAAGGPPDWCYLSSGTWSLLGVEVPRPVITAETLRYNLTNEGGVAGTTRLLKNIMGLWLVQECRRTWARAGRDLSYEELIPRAEAAPPFAALVDPDDATFLAPGDMPAPGRLLHPDRPVTPRRRGGVRPLRPGEPGAEVPRDHRAARDHPRHDDPDDPRRRRRDEERPALPVHRRRLRPPRPRRAGRGHRRRQRPLAGDGPGPDLLAGRRPRDRRPLVPRCRLRAACHRRLGRGRGAVRR